MAASLGDALAAALTADARHVLLLLGGGGAPAAQPSVAAHPERTIACGRGEQTAVLVAAGLAAEGRRPIVLLHAPLLAGRGAALFDALCVAEPLDVLLVVRGDLPPGVAAPRRGTVTAADSADDAAERLPALAAAAGPRVLLVP